jgi:hypothetical protein
VATPLLDLSALALLAHNRRRDIRSFGLIARLGELSLTDHWAQRQYWVDGGFLAKSGPVSYPTAASRSRHARSQLRQASAQHCLA